MALWQEKRILILGTTYPSQSRTYYETVCTGGLEEDTLQMVRLYPVPMRYLESAQRFKKFQWITASISKDTSDPRPESFKIDPRSISLENVVTDHAARRDYLDRSPHLIGSLEELKLKQESERRSLGIVRPKDILDCSITARPASDRVEWDAKEKARLSQHILFGENPKPLDSPRLYSMFVGYVTTRAVHLTQCTFISGAFTSFTAS